MNNIPPQRQTTMETGKSQAEQDSVYERPRSRVLRTQTVRFGSQVPSETPSSTLRPTYKASNPYMELPGGRGGGTVIPSGRIGNGPMYPDNTSSATPMSPRSKNAWPEVEMGEMRDVVR